MQTELIVPRRSTRLTQGSGPWAILLCAGFILTTVLELLTVRFTKGADGRWVATVSETPESWFLILVLIVSVISMIGGVIFLGYRIGEWRRGERVSWSRLATGADVIYMCAWLQFLNIGMLIAAEFFLQTPLFPEGTIGSLFSSASLQIMILVVAFFQFRGRHQAIGLGRPRHLGKMLAVIVVLFLLIVFAMDFLITNPLADLLNLSLESEREQQIESEILSAKQTNLPNVITSILVIGVLVPIAEEILFRGVIQTFLVRRLGAWIGIGLSSLWFALLHVDLALFAPLFLIGAALGFIRHRFQSLWGAVLLHSLNNLMSMFVYFQ
ncbi:CPBP family intramembrane glutamic endopeptidase [Brevibacillus migulae]|uniref:CPBP family intramembrane glutamic endopeptidase n=1 Tax=Brevibacillus migulae TaxID=1644114 RepID=UPI00106EA119|nr:type II CAAX endopeptidase family protein [Brevibacillus migulae]